MKTSFKVQTACNLYVELFKDLITLKPIHLKALCVFSFMVFLHPQRLETLKPAFAFNGIHWKIPQSSVRRICLCKKNMRFSLFSFFFWTKKNMRFWLWWKAYSVSLNWRYAFKKKKLYYTSKCTLVSDNVNSLIWPKANSWWLFCFSSRSIILHTECFLWLQIPVQLLHITGILSTLIFFWDW